MSMIRIGKLGRQEVFYNPDKAYNRHITIQGKSGAGKSVAAQIIILNLVKDNSQDQTNQEGKRGDVI